MRGAAVGVTAAQVQSFAATAVVIASSAGALYRALRKALRKEIADQVTPIAEALTAHMANEVDDLQSVRKELKANRRRAHKADRQVDEIKTSLDERTPLLNSLDETMRRTQSVLDEHMAHDEEVLAASAVALQVGQDVLLTKIDAHHDEAMRSHNDLAESVDDHVKADKEAFARIETTLATGGTQ